MLMLHDPEITFNLASNGEEALRMLGVEAFDLLLLDVIMPEMNGLQVLEQVRSNPSTHAMPVVMISAQDSNDTQPVCIEMTVALGNGIQLAKALECAVGVSEILFRPVSEPYPEPQ